MDDQVLDGIRRMVDKLSDKIVDLEEQLDRYKWISVNDRLPKEGVVVIACYKGVYLEICKCSEGAWVDRFGFDYTGITH